MNGIQSAVHTKAPTNLTEGQRGWTPRVVAGWDGLDATAVTELLSALGLDAQDGKDWDRQGSPVAALKAQIRAAEKTIEHSAVTAPPRRDRDLQRVGLTLIRRWARTHGIPVSERGRVPEYVLTAYREAHS